MFPGKATSLTIHVPGGDEGGRESGPGPGVSTNFRRQSRPPSPPPDPLDYICSSEADFLAYFNTSGPSRRHSEKEVGRR